MRSPFVAGLVNPLNLLMLVLTAIAGLIAAWWLFPVGLVLWLVMVMAVARDPSLRISHEMHSRQPLAERFQGYFDRIERAQVSVFNSLASSSAETRKTLGAVHDEMENLTERVYGLCQRMTTLENYRVVAASTTDLEADLQRVDESIAQASDPQLKLQYEESRSSLLDRINTSTLVVRDLDRVEAQLMGLANEMDSIVTEVVRLQAAGPAEAGQGVPALVARLREQSSQLEKSGEQAVQV
jgi:hypothetical protein